MTLVSANRERTIAHAVIDCRGHLGPQHLRVAEARSAAMRLPMSEIDAEGDIEPAGFDTVSFLMGPAFLFLLFVLSAAIVGILGSLGVAVYRNV
jgi:hypothetical protein